MKRLKKYSLLLLLGIVTTEGYTERLYKKAEEIYGGYDIRVTLSVDRVYRDQTERSGNTGLGMVGLDVPIYSKRDQIDRKQKKIEFVQKGLDYLRKIKENNENLKVLEQKAQMYKSLMAEQGQPAINEFFDTQIQINKTTAESNDAKEKLEAMLQ